MKLAGSSNFDFGFEGNSRPDTRKPSELNTNNPFSSGGGPNETQYKIYHCAGSNINFSRPREITFTSGTNSSPTTTDSTKRDGWTIFPDTFDPPPTTAGIVGATKTPNLRENQGGQAASTWSPSEPHQNDPDPYDSHDASHYSTDSHRTIMPAATTASGPETRTSFSQGPQFHLRRLEDMTNASPEFIREIERGLRYFKSKYSTEHLDIILASVESGLILELEEHGKLKTVPPDCE